MPTTPGSRRTQAQRRAATIEALLDATIESLVEVGYQATSARGIARRAGVSQGAQQHYFSTKVELVDAAMSRMVERLTAERLVRNLDPSATEEDRAGRLLDDLWDMFNQPIITAAFEIMTVARTDPVAAEWVSLLLGHAMATIRSAATQVLPILSKRRGFDDFLNIVAAQMRGVLIVSLIEGTEGTYPTWPTLRHHLLEALCALPTDDP